MGSTSYPIPSIADLTARPAPSCLLLWPPPRWVPTAGERVIHFRYGLGTVIEWPSDGFYGPHRVTIRFDVAPGSGGFREARVYRSRCAPAAAP